MAAAAVKADNQNEHPQCSVCIDTFTDPRTLPCLHTYCFKCIADWCKDKKPREKVACPECRQQFAIPDGGIDSLKKNFYFESMSNTNEIKREYQRMCEVCPGPKKNTSQMFCLQCEQSYCRSCSDCHSRMKNSLFHEQLSLDELQNGVGVHKKRKLLFCDKHTDKQMELFCSEDKVAVCLMCCVLDHRSHHCEEIRKVVDEFRDGKRNQDLQAAIIEVDKNLKVLNSKKLSFFDQVKKVRTKICQKADVRIQMIESHKRKLITDLEKIKANHEREINKVTQEFTNSKSLLNRFTNYCDELLKEGSDIVICQEADGVRRQTEELVNIKTLKDTTKKLSDINVIFSPSSFTFDDTRSILGHVKTEIVHTQTQINGEKYVTAITLMKEELFVTRNDYKRVSVHDASTLELKRKISIPELGDRVCGVAACPINSLLFVSDFQKHRVHIVDLSKNLVSCIKMFGNPSGLSINSKQDVIVTCSGKIRELSPCGKLVRDVSLKQYGMWHAVETAHGTLIVSCSREPTGPTKAIIALSWTGQVLHCYGNQAGSGQGLMTIPYSLAVDSVGNVLVGDNDNDKIQVLDHTLTPARTLQLRADKPCALCYDESTGRLFVGDYHGNFKVCHKVTVV